ncbi:MAG: ATP-dependent zinc metalloprotease FtsH [Silvanigrellales bacterium]|jgi:cell division protease FtsH|nr:ATP-dependent zinc metalloprotease FtsH [Silvanigrellales bacterium]
MAKESWLKAAIIWIAIIALFVLSFKFFSRQRDEVAKPYSEFATYVDKPVEDPKRIVEVTMRGDALRGDEIVAKLKDKSIVTTFAPADEVLRKELREKLAAQQIPLNYERSEDGNVWWASFLTMWLPLLVVVGFMVLFLRNMQGAGGKAMSFGKSKAKLLPESAQRVTFKDVAGVEEAKQECAEIVAFLKDHKRFQEIGARIPKGVLMMGSPGTGKTLLARAIAGEAGVPFFHISGSDFVEMFVGVGASRVRDLFENAKKNAPCIIFIDEIDAVGRHRGAGVGGGHDEREQTLNQLLVEMDGFEANEAVIVIAATNRPDVLDPALLRPGRFDRRVVVNLPDVRGRKEILGIYTKRVKTVDDINVEKLALGTPGFSGADLENLVNEAALMAARNGNKRVSMKDFEYAKDKIMMGSERKSMVLSKDLIRETSYHETGHALVAHYLKSRTEVHKLTVIPRGRALGVTAFLPKEDLYSHTKEDLLTRIAVGMGGRAAEEIKFSQFTTGASNDIANATEMARAMVCQFGMSKLGPINFGTKSENPFLGRDFGEGRNYSETVANEIDQEVSRIINTQYALAKQMLVDHMDVFEHVATILIEVETLDSDEFVAAINGATLDEIRAIQDTKTRSGKSDDTGVTPPKGEATPVLPDAGLRLPSPSPA